MTICFDLKNYRATDDKTGEYLEQAFHHWQEPTWIYRLCSSKGDKLLSAEVKQTAIDTRGDGTVGLVDASVVRVLSPRADGPWKDIVDEQDPAVQRLLDFLRVQLLARMDASRCLVEISTDKLGSRPAAELPRPRLKRALIVPVLSPRSVVGASWKRGSRDREKSAKRRFGA